MKIKAMIAATLVGGLTPVTLPLPIYAAQAGASQCMDQDARLAEIAKNAKPPQSASSIVHMTNLMYVLDEAMKTLDRLCTHEADYSQVRASYKAARDQAFENCKALAGNQSVCVPTRYVRPY